jgi:long-chain acyl-CoA synthetase
MNIVETIRRETAAHADKPAVIEGDHILSYRELLAAANRVAASLRVLGIRTGDRIAFLCDDSTDYVIGSLAILSLPAVVVPISPSLMKDETEAVLDKIDVHALLFDISAHERPGSMAVPADGFARRSFACWKRNARNNLPVAYRKLNAAFIRFSSGTTGTSKGIVLSHESIIQRTDAADRGLSVTAADVVLWVLSMSFHFVVSILLFLRRAATIVLCYEPFPETLLAAVGKQRGTLIYASPFHYHVLAYSSAVSPDDLADVRLAISTAMKLSPETAAAFLQKFGFELAEAYGIIEAGLPFVNRKADPAKRGSVGRILPDYEVRVADADKAGVGRILIRGKGLFDAYFAPWQTRSECLQDGWFATGDVGRLDEDGCLFIVGREIGVINFAGMKIFPYEVEDVIDAHPAVQESLVYAVPHPRFGQLPCAKVVVRPGAATPPDGDALRRFCFARLPAYKVPKAFAFVAELERTASGKLKRVIEHPSADPG